MAPTYTCDCIVIQGVMAPTCACDCIVIQGVMEVGTCLYIAGGTFLAVNTKTACSPFQQEAS